ncbi:MAG TPA: metallophosphoesterase [Hyphomonadaceae bacterium]|nr:metallophosphoesterase [Hyphomonadaceae bacterium]
MSGAILIAAWVGAFLWPAALGFALWRGLKAGRGPRLFGWTAIALTTVIWALGVRAFLWEPETLVVRHVDVESRTWTGAPLRVGIISDIHLGAPHMSLGRLDGIISEMNAEHPDIILLPGDFAGREEPASMRGASDKAEIANGIALLSKLKAPLGVWAVLGNHDWWYDGDAIKKALEAANVHVLENQRGLVQRSQGGDFWIGGLSDYESMRSLPSYSDTLADLPERAPIIVMTHWPDAFAAAPASVALTIAGHTHCGQVNLPFFGRLISASEASQEWACGLYEDHGRKLYVSGGVGTSVMPVRFLQPPEINIVTLRAP